MTRNVFNAQSYRSTHTLTVLLLSAAAGVGLVVWGGSPYGGALQHQGNASRGLADLLFVGGWLLMCIAMMLPTAMPLLTALQRTTAQRSDSNRLTSTAALGFLAVWCAAGIAARAAEVWLHTATENSLWMFTHQRLVAAALLAAGGIYLQLPIAQKCATACRSPMGFIAQRWSGRPDVYRQVARIGVDYGMSCFGCCWPLMLLMCALGMSNPVWMLSFAALMASQKHTRHGSAVTVWAGRAMLAAAGLLLLDNSLLANMGIHLAGIDSWISTICRSWN